MRSSLKRTLTISAATLSFMSASGLAMSASASKIKQVGSTNLEPTTAYIRNYKATGSNAIYNKPGKLSGSKVVASASTAKAQSVLHGYKVAKLSNKSYYMKVVSFDGRYRGYIYVGKKNPVNNFKKVGGGLTYLSTTTSTSLTNNDKKDLSFAKPGTDTQIYKAPKGSQYKVGAAVKDTTDYKGHKLVASKAAMNDMDGQKWLYVSDVTEPTNASGWVLASQLTDYVAPKAPVSVGNDQTTVTKSWQREFYNPATGTKAYSFDNLNLPLLGTSGGSNVNWTTAVKKFNSDATVKGDKKDVVPADTLATAFKNSGLSTVYMKVTPTLLARIPGGLLDKIDSYSGLYMKFDLDMDNIPTTTHYGDQLKLAYKLDNTNLYYKPVISLGGLTNTNADGYAALPVQLNAMNTLWGLLCQ